MRRQVPEAHKVSGFAGKNKIMKKIFSVVIMLILATILVVFRYIDRVLVSVFLPWANTRTISFREKPRTDEIIRVVTALIIYFIIKLF